IEFRRHFERRAQPGDAGADHEDIREPVRRLFWAELDQVTVWGGHRDGSELVAAQLRSGSTHLKSWKARYRWKYNHLYLKDLQSPRLRSGAVVIQSYTTAGKSYFFSRFFFRLASSSLKSFDALRYSGGAAVEPAFSKSSRGPLFLGST